MPGQYIYQCWNIIDSNPRNKLHWNLNQNWCIYTQENAYENVVCKMAAILYRPQCVIRFSFSIYLYTINLCSKTLFIWVGLSYSKLTMESNRYEDKFGDISCYQKVSCSRHMFGDEWPLLLGFGNVIHIPATTARDSECAKSLPL